MAAVVTRGTRQERQNVGIYRQQLLGRNRVIMRWLPHRGGALDYADWRAANPDRPFPVLVAIGADPATMLAAVAPVPDTCATLSRLRPVELEVRAVNVTPSSEV